MSKIKFNSRFLPEIEVHNKIVSLRRVVKVVKGGRRFAFSVLVVVGDRSGRVGYGTGKSREVASAINKAITDAKKHVIKVPLRGGSTLHHDVTASYGATKVILRSAPPGRGLIAGGAGRAVFELLGVKDMVAKIIGSTQPHNVILSAMKALMKVNSPRQFADIRSKKVSDIVRRRSVDRHAPVAKEGVVSNQNKGDMVDKDDDNK